MSGLRETHLRRWQDGPTARSMLGPGARLRGREDATLAPHGGKQDRLAARQPSTVAELVILRPNGESPGEPERPVVLLNPGGLSLPVAGLLTFGRANCRSGRQGNCSWVQLSGHSDAAPTLMAIRGDL